MKTALKYLFVALMLLGISAIPATVLAAGGTGPGDALLPVGQAQTVAPHSAQWYYFDRSGGKGETTAALDDNGAGGIRLAIYTPGEIAAWQNGDSLKAIGTGGALVGHDLGWVGSVTQVGRYYAVVYNDSDNAVTVSLRVTGDQVTTSVSPVVTPTPLVNPFAIVTPLGGALSGKLVFMDASGGNIYTVNGDGTGLQKVTTGLDPAWNSSGTQIAFARQGSNGGIFTINADGSNERLLYNTTDPRAPQWSPDDSLILFSMFYKDRGGQGQCFGSRCFSSPSDPLWKIATVTSADGTYKDVVATLHAFTPTWSSDGNTIAYNDPSIGMMQTSLQGNYDPFNFIGDRRYPSQDYNPLTLLSPQYSPDGKQIVYMVYQQPVWQIAIANADGSNQRLLTTQDPLDFVHPNNVAPTWSPDGKQILFLSDRNGKWEFFTMNADGTGQQQVLKSVTDQITLTYNFQGERMVSWSR